MITRVASVNLCCPHVLDKQPTLSEPARSSLGSHLAYKIKVLEGKEEKCGGEFRKFALEDKYHTGVKEWFK
jgi:hypothetical protein